MKEPQHLDSRSINSRQKACCEECAREERLTRPVTFKLNKPAGLGPADAPPSVETVEAQSTVSAPPGGYTGRASSGKYPVTPWSSQRLYRPFVKWALVIGLTLGSATGAGMLIGRAFGLEMGLWWLTHAQSHGVAQLFGFAGLFTMGIAFHVVPRFRNGSTIFPWPQRATLGLMVVGVVLRMAGQSIEEAPAVSSPLLLASGVSIMAATLIFAGVTAYTLTTGPAKRHTAERWIAVGTAWAVVAASIHLAITVRMAVDSSILGYGPWDRVLIAAGLQGFILYFIFGVSLRAVSGFLGLRQVLTPVEWAGFVALNAGLAVSITAGLTGADAVVSGSGEVLQAAGIGLFILSLRILEPPESPKPPMQGAYPRYAWFIRSAYVWLGVFAVLVLMKGLEGIIGEAWLPAPAFSPVTHVLTLGFITTMIMGMGARMLPLFEGTLITRHRFLDAALISLTVSVALRLLFGYFRTGADAALGTSGTLGLVALALFAWGVLGGHRAIQKAPMPRSVANIRRRSAT